MKDQYFGDENDFLKYGLLRALVLPNRFTLGVCWMLTPSDGRSDGQRIEYLKQPKEHRHRDPVLYDFLTSKVLTDQGRYTSHLADSSLLGDADYHSPLLSDNAVHRAQYFAECAARFKGRDVLFFDPDNGMEISSRKRGQRDSSKYFYKDEASAAFASGSSVLIYQHFARQERSAYSQRVIDVIRQSTNAPTMFSFRTPHVLFVLASHERHTPSFRNSLVAVQRNWHPRMTSMEH